MAGTGKSTISLTVAEEYSEKGRLGASFFFERGGGDLASTKLFATTISRQLQDFSKSLRNLVRKITSTSELVYSSGLASQWEKLVLRPLSELKGQSCESPVLIVIDALDECDSQEAAALLIGLLAKLADLENIHIRILVTSRPEASIISGFRAIPNHKHQGFVLHDIEQTIVDRDITAYYKYQLAKLRLTISDANIQTLVERSQGLFIHAATVCRYIQDGRAIIRRQRLRQLLDGTSARDSAQDALDQVYTTIFKQQLAVQLFDEERQFLRHLVTRIVGSIVALADSMSIPHLSMMLSEPEEEVRDFLELFYSVLDVPSNEHVGGLIRLAHPSFRDFLLSKARNPSFFVDPREVHSHLLTCCLNIMESHLKRNMCEFEQPGTQANAVPFEAVEKMIPRPVRYACRYWVHHLQQSSTSPLDNCQVITFFQQRFLFWLETLAWLGRLFDATAMLRELEDLLHEFVSFPLSANKVSIAHHFVQKPSRDSVLQALDENSDLMTTNWNHPYRGKESLSLALHAILYDAGKFLQSHASTIQATPLQAYCSAIIFSPRSSFVRRMYSNMIPSWISTIPAVSHRWPAQRGVFPLSDRSQAEAFSPSGDYVVVSGGTSLIFVQLSTGIQNVIPRGSKTKVVTMTFSADGQYLMLLATDGYYLCHSSVALIETYKVGMFEDAAQLTSSYDFSWKAFRSARYPCLSFSSRGPLAYCEDGIWEVATRLQVRHLDLAGERNEDEEIKFMVVSPDQEYFFVSWGSARTSEANWAAMWHVRTDTKYRIDATAATFSSHGGIVALASIDKVSIYRLEHGDWVEKGTVAHFQPVDLLGIFAACLIAFSPDSRWIAIASDRERGGIWNVETGQPKFCKGLNFTPRRVTFSSNSKLVAWAADTNSIEIWDVASEQKIQTVGTRDLGDWREMRFSSNDESLIAVRGRYVAVWDICPNTEEPAKPRALREDRILMSPDQSTIMAAYGDKIEQWNVERCQLGHTFALDDLDDRHFTPEVVSPDGKMVAGTSFGSSKEEIRVWNIATHSRKSKYRSPTESRDDSPSSLIFSDDSRCIIAAYSRGEIAVCAVRSHCCKPDMPGIVEILRNRPGLSGGRVAKMLSQDVAVIGFDELTLWSGLYGGSAKEMFTFTAKMIVDSNSITMSKDGRFFAVGLREIYGKSFERSYGYWLGLWDVATGKAEHILTGDFQVQSYVYGKSLAFSPDSKLLALITDTSPSERGSSGEIIVWETSTGTIMNQFSLHKTDGITGKRADHNEPLSLFSFSPCGRFLYTTCGTFTVAPGSLQTHPTVPWRGKWVTIGDQELVFIPPAYQSSFLFAINENVVFTHEFEERILRFSGTDRFVI